MQSLSIVPRCALLCLSARLGGSGRAIAPLHSQGQRAHQIRLSDHAHQAIVCVHDGDVVVAPLGKQRNQVHGVLLHPGHLHGVGHDLPHALGLAAAPHDQGAQALLSRAVALDQQRLGGDSSAEVAALKVDSKSPLKVYNALGVLADLRNDFPSSEAYYNLAMLIEPRSVLVQNSLGYSYYLAGQWPQAERTYQRGIGYDSSYKPLWRNYGLLLARMERYEEALSAFEQIGGRAQASNDVGYICLIEGKLDVAEQFFRSAIEQSPAHYDMAWDNLNRVQQVRRIRQMGGPDSAAVTPPEEAVQ